MKKIFVITGSLLLLSLNVFCQELSGIYKFYYPKIQEEDVLYIKFKEYNFVYFRLGSSIKIIDGIDEIKEVGTGKYYFNKDKIVLDFQTDSTIISPFIYDSVSVSFSSKENQYDIKVSIEYKSLLTDYENASLIIETPLKEYSVLISRDVKKTITIPPGSKINSIKLAAIGMPLKHLPFDVNFNCIDYVFIAKDNRSAIRNFKSQTLEFEIKKSDGQMFYSFGQNGFLKKLNDKELDYLNILSKESDPRLSKLLSY